MLKLSKNLYGWEEVFAEHVLYNPELKKQLLNQVPTNLYSDLEEKVLQAIPKDLEPLRRYHSQCNWSKPEVHSSRTLQSAFRAASYWKEFTADNVISIFFCDVPGGSRVELTFPKKALVDYIRSFQDYENTTITTFLTAQADYMRSLPAVVRKALNDTLYEIARVALMDLMINYR